MDRRDDEDALLQSMALQNAHTILVGPREIEQELRKQYEWWQVTLQSIGDGVITTDTDGRVLTLNRVAQELTGWTQEDSQARPLGEVFRIIDEHSRAALPNPVEQVLRENRVIGLGNSTLLLRRDGRETAI
jgi:PAS domain S-box-containing protein